MRIRFTILFFFVSLIGFGQELSLDFKEYSYTQLFDMINSEVDSVFNLENAFIRFNRETDSLFTFEEIFTDTGKRYVFKRKKPLDVDKIVNLKNVHFQGFSEQGTEENSVRNLIEIGKINRIQFNKDVNIINSMGAGFEACIFNGRFKFSTGPIINDVYDYFSENREKTLVVDRIVLSNSRFTNEVTIIFLAKISEYTLGAAIRFTDNEVILNNEELNSSRFFIFGRNIFSMSMNRNEFRSRNLIEFTDIDNEVRRITENNFHDSFFKLHVTGSKGFDTFKFLDNTFNQPVSFLTDKLNNSYQLDYKQFNNQLVSTEGKNIVMDVMNRENKSSFWRYRRSSKLDSLFGLYQSRKFSNIIAYTEEMALRGMFYEHYKSRFNQKDANRVYVDIKDLETERLKYEFVQNQSFETYFTLKINQFLKVFSAYGTKPAKSIIFSLYVILIFALIYLFFPNSWDKHGKNRIVDRYNFFFKYMKHKAGIHEVYLEDQKQELMSYDQFKKNISNSEQKVPKFFTATALPLYKWAISGTKFSAIVLKRVDIMKGTWNEVPKKKRIWKSFLLIGAFLIAICYDILIKMLNALMLSINTFTTLGFGEIPIKGLPRYLAIIQGFIGWFMLTIFSVSLISQLLN